jgi:hypothetical protein
MKAAEMEVDGRLDGSSTAVSSNLGQNYPYASESEDERESAVSRAIDTHKGLALTIQSESIPYPVEARSWVWKCPTPGCSGLLHMVGYARNARAVFTVCDTCGQTYKR